MTGLDKMKKEALLEGPCHGWEGDRQRHPAGLALGPELEPQQMSEDHQSVSPSLKQTKAIVWK